MPEGPIQPNAIPGYDSPVREGVKPDSPSGEGVNADSPPAGETPTEKLADGTPRSEKTVPYERVEQLSKKNQELQAQVDEFAEAFEKLQTTNEPSFFDTPEPQTAQAKPQADPESDGTEDVLEEMFGKVVDKRLAPLTKFVQWQEQQQRNQQIQRQMEALSQIVPDFDESREKQAMVEALNGRRMPNGGYRLDASDAFLIANKEKVLRALRGNTQTQAADTGGHDLGGSGPSASPDSPDSLMREIDSSHGVDKSSAIQRYLIDHAKKAGVNLNL